MCMKLRFFLIAWCCMLFCDLSAQSEDQIKLDNFKYYYNSMRDNLYSMRYYTDSSRIVYLINQMDSIGWILDAEVNAIVLPTSDTTSLMADADPSIGIDTMFNPSFDLGNTEFNTDEAKEETGLGKFIPFNTKFKTKLKIQFGINSWFQDNLNGSMAPEINTGGSWYWDFSLMRIARIGNKNSKVSINYGISFLKNRFKIENDLQLVTLPDNTSTFVQIQDASSNPKLNVGYLNIPISFSFALGEKTKLELGGYAGYRIHTVQKIFLKSIDETISEYRYASYQLNNWMYGATVSLNVSGFNLIGRYNFSKLFKDGANPEFNTFMIGTSVSLF